jgi:hypothetical protein
MNSSISALTIGRTISAQPRRATRNGGVGGWQSRDDQDVGGHPAHNRQLKAYEGGRV